MGVQVAKGANHVIRGLKLSVAPPSPHLWGGEVLEVISMADDLINYTYDMKPP